MIIDTEAIQKLIDSDISAYQITKNTGLSGTVINEIRRGKRKIENLTLETGFKLSNYWKTLNNTKNAPTSN